MKVVNNIEVKMGSRRVGVNLRKAPHFLITGDAKAGKTTNLFKLIDSFIEAGNATIYSATKNDCTELGDGKTDDDLEVIVCELYQEMRARENKESADMSRLVFIIDEYDAFEQREGSLTTECLEFLLKEGGENNISIVVSTRQSFKSLPFDNPQYLGNKLIHYTKDKENVEGIGIKDIDFSGFKPGDFHFMMGSY